MSGIFWHGWECEGTCLQNLSRVTIEGCLGVGKRVESRDEEEAGCISAGSIRSKQAELSLHSAN